MSSIFVLYFGGKESWFSQENRHEHPIDALRIDAIIYQLMLNSRPSTDFYIKCVPMCMCLCILHTLHTNQFVFFQFDIDFYHCFHSCWPRICDTLLLGVFFSVPRLLYNGVASKTSNSTVPAWFIYIYIYVHCNWWMLQFSRKWVSMHVDPATHMTKMSEQQFNVQCLMHMHMYPSQPFDLNMLE